MKFSKKISRVHFIYIIIILLMIIAFISGISFSDNGVIVDIISVTSGVLSIIIGVLAIFVAIYQGLTQGTSIQKMNESADRVEATTKKLKDTDFDEMGDNIVWLIDSFSELTNDNKQGSKIKGDLHVTKDFYKKIFIHARNESFFSTIIEKSHNLNSPFLINRTGALILDYKKSTKEEIKFEVKLFIRYLNMLRRSGAVAYTVNTKDKATTWVKIEFLSPEFIDAIKDKKSEDNKFKKIFNYVKEDNSLFRDENSL